MCFGTAIFTYMRPVGRSSAGQEKMVALFYAVVTPMLNPLIYSLRNNDVIGALKRTLEKLKEKK
jgi:olfactory receptor